MYDDEFENNNTVLLAEFEWLPFADTVDWKDPNFTKEIVDRIKGVTEESFAREVALWQKSINMMPKYDEYQIRKEISCWNIGIPHKDDFNFETYSLYYSLQMQYRNRINEIISVVNSHHELISQAAKSLKEISIKLGSGTQLEKTAVAAFTVHPFTVAASHAKRLLTYLESVLKNIEFAASQMDRLLKEHQFLSRINNNISNEGTYNLFSRTTPISNSNNNHAEIKTRNKRLQNH